MIELELDPSVERSTHLCFYVPDIDVCLIDERFLSCEKQSNCTQHARNDVIHISGNETMRNITVNLRMMPPDDEKDEAYVIRLYNNTVVWLTNISCYDNSSLLSQEWNPRIYIFNNTTNPTTIPPDSTCSMTASPIATSISTDTQTVTEGNKWVCMNSIIIIAI